MDWICNYELFLFDFDGLLVDTEALHFAAYQKMCAHRGILLNWSFARFCQAAHFHATGVRDALYQEFPSLQKQEPDWGVLYEEKKKAYRDILQKKKGIQLMPGVERLLKAIEGKKITSCVVTHSLKEHVEMIKEAISTLNRIPFWITREDYDKPKPAPDGYLKAVSLYNKTLKGKVIGFEDSVRGLRALQAAEVQAVLVCSSSHPQMKEIKGEKVVHFPSLDAIEKDPVDSAP